MNVNVNKFFELYNNDSQLRARLKTAEEAYPGSLEIRDAVVEATLLPIAAEMGLPFDIKDLRAYETRQKMSRVKPDVEIEEGEPMEEEESYWLLDRGWTNDDGIFKTDEEK